MEQVTPQHLHRDEAARLQPELRDDVRRRRRHRHAPAADEGRRDARGGRVPRPDPLHHQHRAPRRPHLRQLLLQGRRARSSTTRASTTASWSSTPSSTRSPTPTRPFPTPAGKGTDLDDPEGVALWPDRDEYYARPEQGHDRLHRRPDAARRRPHVPSASTRRATRPARSRSTCPRSARSSPATRSSPSARPGS